MYVCKFVRRFFLSLAIVAALAGFSLAQDSTSSTARPSQADCLAAANSGGTPPAGCAQEDSSSGTSMRQQQSRIYADVGPDAAVDVGASGDSGAGDGWLR